MRYPGTPLSRRTVITAAATAGVGVAAVSVLGVANARENGDEAAGGGAGEVIVVQVRDAASGTLEVFTGGRRVEVRDRDLVKQLVRAATKR